MQKRSGNWLFHWERLLWWSTGSMTLHCPAQKSRFSFKLFPSRRHQILKQQQYDFQWVKITFWISEYPPAPISSMGTPEPEGSGWSEPTSMPAVVNIVNDPVYIDDHPYGYHLRYPETGNQYPNNANVTWDIRLRNQPGKVRTLHVFLAHWNSCRICRGCCCVCIYSPGYFLHGNFFVGPLIPPFWTSGDVCPGFQSQGGSLVCFLTCVILRFTSGMIPAHFIYIGVSMTAEPFQSTYLQMCPQALVEVWGSNPQPFLPHAASTVL